MPGTARLEIDQTEIIATQSPECLVELTNTGGTPLEDVNGNNKAGGPTLLVTNKVSGERSKISAAQVPGAANEPVSVAPRGQLRFNFSLNAFLTLTQPGEYEIQAQFTWDGGEATTDPVTLRILPSTPESADVRSAYGGAAPLYLAAWVNHPDADGGKRTLWLTTFDLSRKPRHRNSTRGPTLSAAIAPVLSVPANDVPRGKYVAWRTQKGFEYVSFAGPDVPDIHNVKLDHAEAKFCPPLLINELQRGETVARADTLLYEPPAKPDGAGVFRLLRLSSDGRVEAVGQYDGPTRPPEWMETAFFKGMRVTLVATSEENRCHITSYLWNARRPTFSTSEGPEWMGTCRGGAQWVVSDSEAVGAVLLESGPVEHRRYEFQTWRCTSAGHISAESAVQLSLPEKASIQDAVVSISEECAPHALIKLLGENAWQYVAANGSTGPTPTDQGAVRMPARVLYRRLNDPTILFSRDQDGFAFMQP